MTGVCVCVHLCMCSFPMSEIIDVFHDSETFKEKSCVLEHAWTKLYPVHLSLKRLNSVLAPVFFPKSLHRLRCLSPFAVFCAQVFVARGWSGTWYRSSGLEQRFFVGGRAWQDGWWKGAARGAAPCLLQMQCANTLNRVLRVWGVQEPELSGVTVVTVVRNAVVPYCSHELPSPTENESWGMQREMAITLHFLSGWPWAGHQVQWQIAFGEYAAWIWFKLT